MQYGSRVSKDVEACSSDFFVHENNDATRCWMVPATAAKRRSWFEKGESKTPRDSPRKMMIDETVRVDLHQHGSSEEGLTCMIAFLEIFYMKQNASRKYACLSSFSIQEP